MESDNHKLEEISANDNFGPLAGISKNYKKGNQTAQQYRENASDFWNNLQGLLLCQGKRRHSGGFAPNSVPQQSKYQWYRWSGSRVSRQGLQWKQEFSSAEGITNIQIVIIVNSVKYITGLSYIGSMSSAAVRSTATPFRANAEKGRGEPSQNGILPLFEKE